MRRNIQQKIDLNHGENRLSMNRPQSPSIMHDFAPDSPESRVAEAANQFGLNFINNLNGEISESKNEDDNVVISPLSLQNLLNMLLLGSTDNSATYQELVKVLGYDKTNLLATTLDTNTSTNERLKPHEAMKSLIQSIQLATHLLPTLNQSLLLNTNPSTLSSPSSLGDEKDSGEQKNHQLNLEAHLQTNNKDQALLLSEQVNFTMANLVLSNKDVINLQEPYEKELKKYYGVKVEQFSSSRGADNNATTIEIPLHQKVNNWVKNMTQNQFEKLVEEGDLSGKDLIMVLLNAAHFKGRWLHTFSPKATQESVFYNDGDENKPVKVPFMRQKALFGFTDLTSASMLPDSYSPGRVQSSEDSETITLQDANPITKQSLDMKIDPSNTTIVTPNVSTAPSIELSKEDSKKLDLVSKLNCSVLMMPFSINDGQELSMVIFLPAKRDGIKHLQSSLTGPVLNEVYKLLVDQQVRVELPKFSFESSTDAKKTLEHLGISQIFKAPAQLDRMFTLKGDAQQTAKVDKVIHKAKITVDETGAEAAAASMATIVLRNFVRPPTSFVVDRPFLFVIRHNRSNMPIFMGRVNKL